MENNNKKYYSAAAEVFSDPDYKPGKLAISNGNAKLGKIPNISLAAVLTCRPDAPCCKLCYAVKFENLRENAKKAWARNTRLYINAPDSYFSQFRNAVKMARFFRLHVSGDFPDPAYFAECCKIAAESPHCTILAFTKQYEIVNGFIENGGTIPSNFKIVFSNWAAWKCQNPHNFPTAEVIFKNSIVPDNWKICPGNCANCACRNTGCWTLEKGETIAFHKH